MRTAPVLSGKYESSEDEGGRGSGVEDEIPCIGMRSVLIQGFLLLSCRFCVKFEYIFLLEMTVKDGKKIDRKYRKAYNESSGERIHSAFLHQYSFYEGDRL